MSNYGKYEPYYPQARRDSKFPEGYNRVLLTNPVDLANVLEFYEDSLVVAFDCETTGLNHKEGEMVGFSFAFGGDAGFYVPMRHVIGENMPLEAAQSCLGFLATFRLLLYNAKFDLRWMREEGVDLENARGEGRRVDFLDVMSLVYNMDTNIANPSLKFAMQRLLGWNASTYEETLGGAVDLSQMDPEGCVDYAVFDVLSLVHLMGRYSHFYKENKFIVELDSQVVWDLMRIEEAPHPIDVKVLKEVTTQLKKYLKKLEVKIFKTIAEKKVLEGIMAKVLKKKIDEEMEKRRKEEEREAKREAEGKPPSKRKKRKRVEFDLTKFNLRSSKQLGEVLSHLGISTGKYTEKTNAMQVDEKALEGIEHLNPAIPIIVEWKKREKLLNSYAEKLGKAYDEREGKLRFNYFSFRVPTGRLASGGDGKNSFFCKYNIQSTANPEPMMYRVEECDWEDPEGILGWKFIPDRKGNIEGYHQNFNVRRAFIPLPGCYFLHVDYSGQELRIPANLSKDPVMIEAFNSGEDYHKRIALQLVGGDESKYDKELRKLAKAANFGNLYGGTDETMVNNLGCDSRLAAEIYKKWWDTHSGLKSWVRKSEKKAENQGYIQTYFGRIRRMRFDYKYRRNFANRTTINTQVQGTAGDMMRIALIELGKLLDRIGDPKLRILSSVHDEVNFSIPKDKVFEYLPEILECMDVTPEEWEVPMEVDFGFGHSWGYYFSFDIDEEGRFFPKS